jgi:hypothetical protein
MFPVSSDSKMIKARERFALDKIVKWATFTLPEGVPAG